MPVLGEVYLLWIYWPIFCPQAHIICNNHMTDGLLINYLCSATKWSPTESNQSNGISRILLFLIPGNSDGLYVIQCNYLGFPLKIYIGNFVLQM